MKEHAEIALSYARDHPDWQSDQFAIDAIAKRVEALSKVAGYRVPKSRWIDYPSVPWIQITGMRHHLVHGYDELDVKILAETIERDLPALITEIDRLLPQ